MARNLLRARMAADGAVALLVQRANSRLDVPVEPE
jgi:hypothetical protein